MQKLAVIIGAALLLAGIAAAGTFASLGSGSDNATISTKPAPRAAVRVGDIRREDRATEVRGRENEPGEDLRGRENEPGEDVAGREAEPNDDRGAATVIAPSVDDNAVADDHSGRGSSNSGPGSDSDHGGGSDDSGSGHGGGGGDD
jgi:hypothetical protein